MIQIDQDSWGWISKCKATLIEGRILWRLTCIELLKINQMSELHMHMLPMC